METLQLTKDEWDTIVHALRTAQDSWGDCARQTGMPVLAKQFWRQVEAAKTLEAKIYEEVDL